MSADLQGAKIFSKKWLTDLADCVIIILKSAKTEQDQKR